MKPKQTLKRKLDFAEFFEQWLAKNITLVACWRSKKTGNIVRWRDAIEQAYNEWSKK